MIVKEEPQVYHCILKWYFMFMQEYDFFKKNLF